MKWFGRTWGAPCCREEDHLTQVPPGTCHGCRMEVEDIDQGLAIPSQTQVSLFHQQCFLRNVTGQTLHILHEGMSYCQIPGVPRDWRPGHTWVRFDEWRTASCPHCRQLGPVKYPSDREAAGLVATLGWDPGEFKTRIEVTPSSVLTLVEKILVQDPRSGEPTHVEERSRMGLEMILRTIQGRAGVGNDHAIEQA